MSDKKPTNTKETGEKDLDDLLDSKSLAINLFIIQLCGSYMSHECAII